MSLPSTPHVLLPTSDVKLRRASTLLGLEVRCSLSALRLDRVRHTLTGEHDFENHSVAKFVDRLPLDAAKHFA